MPKKYIVTLTADERAKLKDFLSKGASQSRKLKRAQILLLADAAISEHLLTNRSTVERTRKRFVDGGLENALNEVPRPGQACKLNGKDEALLIALACSDPPESRVRWTFRLLAAKAVELKITDTISHETVRQVLKKAKSSRGKKNVTA